MAVEIPAYAIADAQAADPELWPVLLALAGPESGWNPRAVGDGGCSLGYLQMNTCGGLGDGRSRAELFDGTNNFALGAEYLRRRLADGASLWDALQPWSARPAAWNLLARIESEGIVGVDVVPPVAGFPGGGAAVWILVAALVAVVVLGG